MLSACGKMGVMEENGVWEWIKNWEPSLFTRLGVESVLGVVPAGFILPACCLLKCSTATRQWL